MRAKLTQHSGFTQHFRRSAQFLFWCLSETKLSALVGLRCLAWNLWDHVSSMS